MVSKGGEDNYPVRDFQDLGHIILETRLEVMACRNCWYMEGESLIILPHFVLKVVPTMG